MSDAIARIAGNVGMVPSTRVDGRGATGGPDFGEALMDAVDNAASAERKADDMAKRFAEGDPDVGIHEVMIASEKASVALKYTVTLKNKVIAAYQELMNTQV